MTRSFVRRVFRLPALRRSEIERELRDELQVHLDLRVADLERQGFSPDEARAEALRRLGSATEVERRVQQTAKRREGRMRWTALGETVVHNLRVVVRQLRRAPVYTLTVVCTLALGVGANATMFGVLDRLLLRAPAGVTAPERIGRFEVEVGPAGKRRSQSSFGYGHFRDLERAIGDRVPMAAYSFASDYPLGRGSTAQRVHAQLVTSRYFEVVGVRAAAGRTFLPEDGAEPNGQRVAVVSDRFWRTRLGARDDAIGQRLLIGDHWFTIVGVTPPGFVGLGLGAIELWLPITAADGLRLDRMPNWLTNHDWFWLGMIARLPADSGAIRDITQHATVISSNGMWGKDPVTPRFTSMLRRASSQDVPDVKVARLLTAVSFLVLLIACANVANLLLARAVNRQREIAVRLALGITRGRLASLLSTETLVLSVVGGLLSLIAVQLGGRVVRLQLLSNVTAWSESLVDGRIVAFTAVMTLLTALTLGLVPLMQSKRVSLTSVMRQSSRTGAGATSSRARVALLVLQVALCTALTIGTALFIRSLRNATSIHLGMDVDKVVLVRADLRSVGIAGTAVPDVFERLRQRATTVPGVVDASIAMGSPFVGYYGAPISVPGIDSLPKLEGDDGWPTYNAVDEHFFSTLGTRVVRGRAITAEDIQSGRDVAVVNTTMARLYWPRQDALGKCIKVGFDAVPCSTVVGISEDAHRGSVVEAPTLQVFTPLKANRSIRLMFIRVAGDASLAAERLRRVLQTSDPSLPYLDVQPLTALIESDLRPWRMGALLLGAFAAIAMLIGAVGLYGSFAYEVAQRRRELSIRKALGANDGDLIRLVVGRSAAIATIGCAIGVALALTAAPRTRDLLYGTSPRDPGTFAAVVAMVMVIAILATLIPATRVGRIELREAMVAD